ncbi:uncharacterized protein LY89DRAFT_673847 [Mollisia scopiformis]|uniref:Heterokaryon incompatibility domain-containing protein n=1 Tax=Mollisia scopiformis TaxID=149040 RepID=A0A194WVR6_MOLSC|nr:uncharacterized protein LY89DRAFT_673847 [Mollisia scopiformis]KUJ12058.1 hypothetical protein LY89DRAFT_673847 [Mollisia scopiformis]
MEHLPPVTKAYEPISVPFIGETEYDGLEFASYPTRRGFDLDRLLQGDLQGRSTEAVASFLQDWLYFGFMHELLGIEIQRGDFVRTDDAGREWITAQKLPGLLYLVRQQIEIEKALPYYTAEFIKKRNQRVADCLSLEYHVWEQLSRLPANPLPPEVSLSIQFLAITLQVGVTQLLMSKSAGQLAYRNDIPWERGLHFRITRSPFLTDRMVKQGWCPIVIEQIRSHSNVVGQYYASLLGPPLRKLDHSCCSKDDKDCQGIAQLRSLKLGHETENCQCQILTVDHTKLHAIINEHEIPILRLVEENGVPTLDVISSSSEPGLEYTAMSHVWTDGWGNPDSNSLPLCRVQKLVASIAASYEMPDFKLKFPDPENVKWYRYAKNDNRVFFWMDTLCVPRSPVHIYARAILQMRDVYANAERVLVFDAELMAAIAEATYEELNMRIRCSRWIRRLWTLQEAVLGKRLIFQFKERCRMLETSSLNWMARRNDLGLNYFNTVGWDCDTTFHLYGNMQGVDLIDYLWKLLISDRAVTVESDEPICGAILMNFDMKALMEAPIPDRMKIFWKLHKDQMPISILFVPGSRLRQKGYRWAPSSLLPCQKVGIRMNERGTVTDEGFRIKLPAYSCFTITPLLNKITAAVVQFLLDGNKYYIKKSPVRSNPPWEGLELHSRANLALVIEVVLRVT